jgi:hypothetical protein
MPGWGSSGGERRNGPSVGTAYGGRGVGSPRADAVSLPRGKGRVRFDQSSGNAPPASGPEPPRPRPVQGMPPGPLGPEADGRRR